MKKNILIGFLLGVIATLCFSIAVVHAQSGNVISLAAIPGSTKAANCGTPTTPSLCIVGDGAWLWQSAATGWYIPGAGAQGPPGPTGATGAQGPAGPQGPPGSSGTAGVSSINGHTGALTLNVGAGAVTITP